MNFQIGTDEDIKEYYQFCLHHAHSLSRALPDELWHYTDATGLIGILQSKQIWSTQISCLNDASEQRHFGDLVHAKVKERRRDNKDPLLEPLFRVADEALRSREFTAVGQFVACFSEARDDLGQWRGYGGGECGYAIGFSSNGILSAISPRVNTLLMPMIYADSVHNFVASDVIRMGEVYYRQGLCRGNPDLWTQEFVTAFGDVLSLTAANVKHPKFSGEAERRIVTMLQPGEQKKLEFRQKRTMLARHLPISLVVEEDGACHLPITRIVVGPGPAQRVSKVSVGELLVKFDYQHIPVELSEVPYRQP